MDELFALTHVLTMAADVNLTVVNTFQIEVQGVGVQRFKGSGFRGSEGQGSALPPA
jgi:hypothetical protein